MVVHHGVLRKMIETENEVRSASVKNGHAPILNDAGSVASFTIKMW